MDHLVNQLGRNVLVTRPASSWWAATWRRCVLTTPFKTMALQRADLVVCDEFSLMDQLKLSRVTSRMSQATAAGAPRKVLLLVRAQLWDAPICCLAQCATQAGMHRA